MKEQLSGKHAANDLSILREKIAQLQQREEYYRTIEARLIEKAADLNLINDLNHAFNRNAPLVELLNLLAAGTKELYDCGGATAYLASPDMKKLTLLKHYAVLDSLKKAAKIARHDIPHEVMISLEKESVYAQIIQKGTPMIINDQETIERMIMACAPNAFLKKMTEVFKHLFGTHSVMVVPLIVTKKTIGILDASRSKPFTEEELTRFTDLAKHVAVLLHHYQTEQHLKESESRYRSFVTNFHGIAYRGNLDFTAVFFHGAVKEITGYTEDDFVRGQPRWDEVICPEDMERIEDSIRRIATEPHYSCTREYRIIRKDGSRRWVREHSRNVCDDNGRPLYAEGSIYDISKEKRSRDALFVSEKKFRQFFEQEPAYCYMISPAGTVIDVNNTALAVLGYDKHELLGKPLSMIYAPDCRERAQQLFQQWKQTGLIDDAELTIISKTGECRTILLSTRAVRDESGTFVYSISVQKDITAQKNAEEQIRAALEEKKALLREIHHRVKNNLQVISSLLNLQAHYIDNEKYQHFFKESQDRIKTMVLIHEKLYQSESLAAVSPSDYITGIVRHLLDSYRMGDEEVGFESTIEDSPIDIDLAIPCGLIINELVSNALKHAFVSITSGTRPLIRVSLLRHGDNMTLVVSDNGCGVPPDIDFGKTRTLGLQLVHSLAKQLNARTTVERKNGTTFTFTFHMNT